MINGKTFGFILSFFVIAVNSIHAKQPIQLDFDIEVEIISKFNPHYPETRNKISEIKSEPFRCIRVRGWVKVESSKTFISPEKFYLEWKFSKDGNEQVLDSYEYSEIYQFSQRTDSQNTYYWVVKRIWTDNTGCYIFVVKIRRGKKYREIGRAELIVE